MALDKTLVPVLFKGGLDQKTPPKLSVPGSFLDLENVVRRKTGQLEKRPGFTALSGPIDGYSFTELNHAAVHKDEIVVFGDAEDPPSDPLEGYMYGYSPSTAGFTQKGAAGLCAIESVPAFRDGVATGCFDVAYGGGHVCTVWESGSKVYYNLTDTVSGGTVLSGVLFSSNPFPPKVIYHNSGFTLLGQFGYTQLWSQRISLDGTPTIGSINTLHTTISSQTGQFDACAYGNVGLFAIHDNGELFLGYIAADGSLGTAAGGLANAITWTTGLTNVADVAISADPASDRIWATVVGAAGLVTILVANDTFAATGTATYTSVTSEVFSSIGHVATGGDVWIVGTTLYSSGSEDSKNVYHLRWTWSGSGSPTEVSEELVWADADIAAKPFVRNDVVHYLVRTNESDQPIYVLVDWTERMWGFAHYQGMGELSGALVAWGGYSMPRFTEIESGVWGTGVYAHADFSRGGSVSSLTTNVNRITFDFVSRAAVSTQFGGSLLTAAGGTLYHYDGARVVEHGFSGFPPAGSGTAAGAAGVLAAGEYSARFVYEWVDAQGQVHRSAASPTITTTVTANQTLTYSIRGLQFTGKTDARLVCYMADVDLATVYYRIADTSAYVAPGTQSQYVTLLIGNVAGLTENQILYTVGGGVDHIITPPINSLCVHKNRVFATSAETVDALYFTKAYTFGEGAAFSDILRLAMPSEGGRLTAVASLDDKLAIFKRSQIYVLVGEGPTDTGQQWDYGEPLRIANDVGCVDPRSVVVIPAGILFKSEKGIYLLDRGLRTVYIGAAVEDYNGETITSAVLIADQSEVRFTTAANDCLVYNYLFNTWSNFSNYAATGAAALGTDYYHITSAGVVNQEIPGQFDDNGTRYSMAIETSWLSFAGIQGYQRVYMAQLLGDLVSNHVLRVQIAYDQETTYNETINFNTATNITGTNLKVEVRPARQKCEAIKFRITDQDTIGVGSGGSFKLVATTFQVGRKMGANKLRAQQKAGNG